MPISATYSGTLARSGGNSYIVVPNGTWYLLMLDLRSTGIYSTSGVLLATQHFAGLGINSPIEVSGFIQSDDIDGTGDMEDVLHMVGDLTQ